MGWVNRIRLRWFGTTVRIRGVLVPIDCPAISNPTAAAIRKGYYEVPEIELLTKYLEKDDVVLELGGGIGLISTISAARIKPLLVTVVEADRRMVDIIRATHYLNGTFASVKWGAVSGEDGGSHIDFFERSDFLISSLSAQDSPWIRKYQVPRISLLTLVREVDPTFLIVDIEGAEVSLLDRVTDLGSVSKIIIEVHSHLHSENSIQLLKSNIERLGFQIKEIKGLVHFYIRR